MSQLEKGLKCSNIVAVIALRQVTPAIAPTAFEVAKVVLSAFSTSDGSPYIRCLMAKLPQQHCYCSITLYGKTRGYSTMRKVRCCSFTTKSLVTLA